MSIIFPFHYLNTSIAVFNSIPCSAQFQVLILHSRVDIKNKFKIDR